jgi:hypothetical protein
MMVRVYNKNVHPYKEKWRGTEYNIAPGGFVEMDFYDAHNFLGTKQPNIEVDGNGIPRPTSYKMLEIVKMDGTDKLPEIKHYICQACNKEFGTKAALDNHAEEMHLDQMTDEDAVKAIIKKRGRPKKGAMSDASGDRDGSEAKV